MPFCPECGKSVSPTQKFCRNCGASLFEESPAAAAVPPPAAPLCRSCGAPLAPDEKFCGICGTKTGELPPAPPASPEPAAKPVEPVCPACGSPMTSEMKFCGICGASRSFQPAPPPASHPPPAQAPPAPVSAAAPLTVTVCRACGNPIHPGDKFCSKCLVKVPESSAVTAAAPVSPPPAYQPPPPAQVPPAPAAAPVSGTVCRACGNPIHPGDKFCSKCLVKVPESPAVTAAAPVSFPPASHPPSAQAPSAPVPAAAPVPGTVCRACGNPIHPGDKFCSKCLVKVPESPAVTPAAPVSPPPAYQPPPPPQAAPAPAAPQGYVCASCGSPLSGSEKFCGICGTTVVAARAPVPPAPAPAGRFCGTCGAAISASTRFCGSCGAAASPSSPGTGDTSVQPAPPVTAGGEEVIGVIANARKVKLFGASWDTWNIVVTDRRMILVQMTGAMLTAAVAEAQAKAKAEGKGFFGIMKDQLSAQFGYAVRYETMHPDTTLAETPGNLALANDRISAINLKLKDTGSGDMDYTEFKLGIQSADGTFEYLMAEDDRYVELLKQVYGDRVHMPPGYFRVGGTRIKFF